MSGAPGTEHLTDEEFLVLMAAHGHRWGKSFLPLNLMNLICTRCLVMFHDPGAIRDCDRLIDDAGEAQR